MMGAKEYIHLNYAYCHIAHQKDYASLHFQWQMMTLGATLLFLTVSK